MLWINRIIEEQFGVDRMHVRDTMRFAEDLQADALDMEELRMKMEYCYGISVPTSDFFLLKTVGEARAFIEALM